MLTQNLLKFCKKISRFQKDSKYFTTRQITIITLLTESSVVQFYHGVDDFYNIAGFVRTEVSLIWVVKEIHFGNNSASQQVHFVQAMATANRRVLLLRLRHFIFLREAIL